MQRVKMKITVPVPLDMYQRVHESLLAPGGDVFQEGSRCGMPLLILGSLSPRKCNDRFRADLIGTLNLSLSLHRAGRDPRSAIFAPLVRVAEHTHALRSVEDLIHCASLCKYLGEAPRTVSTGQCARRTT